MSSDEEKEDTLSEDNEDTISVRASRELEEKGIYQMAFYPELEHLKHLLDEDLAELKDEFQTRYIVDRNFVEQLLDDDFLQIILIDSKDPDKTEDSWTSIRKQVSSTILCIITFIRESYKRIPVVETERVVALVHREIDDVLKTLPPFSSYRELVTNVKWHLVEFEKKMKKAEEEESAVRPTTSHGTKRGLASDLEI